MLAPWLFGLLTAAPLLRTPPPAPPQGRVVVENFDRYAPGDAPVHWHRIEGRTTVPIEGATFNRPEEYFRVARVDGRQALEVHTRGRSHSILVRNGLHFRWRLRERPYLAWSWRAEHLPAGAREDRKTLNDAGLAVLVTFDTDFLGRPRSIKYTYSATLPVGTVVDYERLQVIVVSSGARTAGRWIDVRRNVAADFAAVFGGRMPDTPLSVTFWSDSDSTGDYASGYFDDLAIAP